MHLYELTEQIRGLQLLIEEGEIDPQALSDTLDGLQGDIQVKAENLLAYVANMDSDATAIDSEIKRLQARKKTITNRQDSLRNYLRDNMESAEIDKIVCPLFSVTLRKPTQAVSVTDIAGLPPQYTRTTIAADKVLIKADLKAGKKIPGCRLIDGKRGLVIK